MGDWIDSLGGFEEDPEVLRVLREAREREGHDYLDYSEVVRGLRSDLRGEISRFYEQLLRYGSVQEQSPRCDPTRWGFVKDRRQHASQFDRVARRLAHEREIQTELH